jgi:hypothetical protein
MANIDWQAYYFASLYVSSPSARTEPNEADGEDDAASVAGVRMDVCKRDDPSAFVAEIAEPPRHSAIMICDEVAKTPALH